MGLGTWLATSDFSCFKELGFEFYYTTANDQYGNIIPYLLSNIVNA